MFLLFDEMMMMMMMCILSVTFKSCFYTFLALDDNVLFKRQSQLVSSTSVCDLRHNAILSVDFIITSIIYDLIIH